MDLNMYLWELSPPSRHERNTTHRPARSASLTEAHITVAGLTDYAIQGHCAADHRNSPAMVPPGPSVLLPRLGGHFPFELSFPLLLDRKPGFFSSRTTASFAPVAFNSSSSFMFCLCDSASFADISAKRDSSACAASNRCFKSSFSSSTYWIRLLYSVSRISACSISAPNFFLAACSASSSDRVSCTILSLQDNCDSKASFVSFAALSSSTNFFPSASNFFSCSSPAKRRFMSAASFCLASSSAANASSRLLDFLEISSELCIWLISNSSFKESYERRTLSNSSRSCAATSFSSANSASKCLRSSSACFSAAAVKLLARVNSSSNTNRRPPTRRRS
mmetsp:Transcript_55936/g.155979  ORF Transcript_55936/g.155979 Transcript_55936/m.155979 type:complete len:336 (-) Transcript_55936:403-1410(-)